VIDKANRGWFKPFARTGYAARGLIYTVISFFAILAAIGSGEEMGSREALQTILGSAAGDASALILLVAMVSYVVWRLIQSIFDTDRHGLGLKGAAIRGGLLASAGTYVILAVYTFGLWQDSSGGSGGSNLGEQITDALAGFFGSQVIALVLTVVFFGVGVAHIVKAYKRGYARHFEAPPEAMRFIHPVSRTGLVARGLAFVVVGVLFFSRGLSAANDGSSTPGVEDALSYVQQLPFGGLLLGAMGVGLAAFALYSFLQAIWRRINVEDADVPGS
jgi:hypothetical protein